LAPASEAQSRGLTGQPKARARTVTYLYHEVTDDPSSTGFQGPGALPYKHGVAEFAKNLDAIARSGMTPSRVDELDLSSDASFLLLTFDDGGKSALHISRELDARGWRGHFFVTTKFIDDPNFLTRAEVRDIHDRGHVIGAHSHAHPVPFYSQTRERLRSEWQTSTSILSDITGKPTVTASVPGGDVDAVVQETAAEAGIQYLFTSEPTYTPWRAGGLTNFGRVYPLAGTSVARVAAYTRLEGFRRDMTKRVVKRVGRKALGPLYRLVIERSFRPRG
jgi:peptidoglycan/xylan/chitin deacetylase (PgdA/CDA1 family)